MPQLARAFDEVLAPEFAPEPEYVTLPTAATVVTPWGVAAEAGESPVQQLHDRLVETFERPVIVDQRLPVRTRLLIVTAAVFFPWVLGVAALLAL